MIGIIGRNVEFADGGEGVVLACELLVDEDEGYVFVLLVEIKGKLITASADSVVAVERR